MAPRPYSSLPRPRHYQNRTRTFTSEPETEAFFPFEATDCTSSSFCLDEETVVQQQWTSQVLSLALKRLSAV